MTAPTPGSPPRLSPATHHHRKRLGIAATQKSRLFGPLLHLLSCCVPGDVRPVLVSVAPSSWWKRLVLLPAPRHPLPLTGFPCASWPTPPRGRISSRMWQFLGRLCHSCPVQCPHDQAGESGSNSIPCEGFTWRASSRGCGGAACRMTGDPTPGRSGETEPGGGTPGRRVLTTTEPKPERAKQHHSSHPWGRNSE